MAVVQPKRTEAQQVRLGAAMVTSGVVLSILVGIVGPIILAIVVGAIWGGY